MSLGDVLRFVSVGFLVFMFLQSVVSASSEFKSFTLNVAGRVAFMDGKIDFVSVDAGLLQIRIGDLVLVVPVSPGDRVEIVFKNTTSGFLVITNTGTVLCINMPFESIAKNGRVLAVNGEILRMNLRIDLNSLNSNLKLSVTRSVSGPTVFYFNGTELINDPDSDDEIAVLGLTATEKLGLNVRFGSRSLAASGNALTAFINGNEVPEINTLGMIGFLAASTIASLTYTALRKSRKNENVEA